MKASTSRSWKKMHTQQTLPNTPPCTQPFPPRLCFTALVPLLLVGLCPAFLHHSRSLTSETHCHKLQSKRLYNALKRCMSLQRRTAANYSLLEARENHLQHISSHHIPPSAAFSSGHCLRPPTSAVYPASMFNRGYIHLQCHCSTKTQQIQHPW